MQPLIERDLPDVEAARRRLQDCAGEGIFRHAVAETLGGFGDGFAELVIVHEQLGLAHRDNGLILSMNAHLWGCLFPMIHYGTEGQRQTYLSDLISSARVGGHAITEPQAGSDLTALAMSAEKSAGGFLLNGCKRYISNSPIADLMVVYARLDDQLSAFIVHREDAGASFTDSPQVTGCENATMGDVILRNCLIPLDRQLGKTGSGSMMIQQALELERAFIFAGIAGVMAWQLDTVIQYSRERRVKGSYLGRYQAISHKIAEMKLRLDTIRLWVNECARLKDSNKRITLASAQTKLFAAEAFLQSSLDAVQILGASGLEQGSPLAKLVHDALASRLFSGSSEIQKNIIAALMGTDGAFFQGPS